MKKDPGHFLNELPIWKLKLVAKEHAIDVSACKYKRDYVERIAAKNITEEQARDALSNARKEAGSEKAKAVKEEIEEIGKDIKKIADRPSEPKDMPSDEEKALDRHIDEALTMKPSFFEVDSANEAALNKMTLGDYHDAIKANREARLKCLDQFSGFQVYSAAVSIRAAEEMLSKLPGERAEVTSGLKTSLAAAKMAFVHGTPRQREETLESLESLATKAYEVHWGESDRAEDEFLELLRDYESFGTRTGEARRYLEIATSAKRSQDLEEHARMMERAREAAESAKKARKQELDGVYHIVRAAAAEAEDSGADTAGLEKGLSDAKKELEDGSMSRALKLMADIERAADAAHVERLRASKELEEEKLKAINSTVVTYDPILREAASYGMDVREPAFHAGNIRTALDRNDIVNAAKFARRVREIMGGMEKELDSKRIESGAATKVEDAKCGKCGEESLYSFPGSLQKCTSCGHSFSVLASQPAPGSAPDDRQAAEASQAPADKKTIPEERAMPEEKKKRWFKW